MSLASFDYYAYHSHSPLARASVWAKVALIVVILTGIVIGNNVEFLLSWYLLSLLLLVMCNDLPFWSLFLATLYPLVFAVILVLGFYGADVNAFLIVGTKVLAASTTMVAVLATTPYPALFRSIGFMVTPLLSSILLLTYRSFFLLIGIFTESIAMVRLRGGLTWAKPIQSLHHLAHIVGLTIVRAIELSEVQYESMRLRGFTGRMYYTARQKGLLRASVALWCFNAVLIALMIIAYA